MRRRFIFWLSLMHLTAAVVLAQADARSPAIVPAAPAPFYLQRGDDIEKRYNVYREQLQSFFDGLSARLKNEAPDLLAKMQPPAAVPFGYQILPKLLPDGPRRAGRSRVVLSPFSWSRTEFFLERDRKRLDSLKVRLGDAVRAPEADRRRQYGPVVDEYMRLESGHKFIASLIQYNRLWQGEVAKHPEVYQEFKASQNAVLEREQLNDMLSFGEEHADPRLRARADSLSVRIQDEIRKLPTPGFVRADHPEPHQWVVTTPVYTDISDSAFVESFRQAIENAWHVRDGDDDFKVVLEIHRVSPAQLYPEGNVPENGAHIDLARHVARFPPGGIVLTTGANTIYASGRSILLGPYAIGRGALVHEFGHMLGFKDGYFRSYDDRGADGYEILEVILDPNDIVGTPEHGGVRREHFKQVLREKTR